MKKILVLGCSGSIGTSTLDIINSHRDDFQLVGIQAHKNESSLLKQAEKWPEAALCLSGTIPRDKKITFQGPEGILDLISACDPDIVVNGIVGASGLMPTIHSIQEGRDIALANKESMVLAGPLIKKMAAEKSCRILPVDSEHSAVFNLLNSQEKNKVSEIILTASGGPFRNLPVERFPSITLKDALNHPTWEMGNKITIDSATMANKGLEVIEAQQLFDFPMNKIKVLIHPQSYVHSLIRTNDMALYAQISKPDMRLPIQDALYYPEMKEVPWTYLDLAGKTLEFQAPDYNKFPMLKLAYDCGDSGNGYPIAYNGANEIAVDAFLNERISYTRIAELTEQTLQMDWNTPQDSPESILETDQKARNAAISLLGDSKL